MVAHERSSVGDRHVSDGVTAATARAEILPAESVPPKIVAPEIAAPTVVRSRIAAPEIAPEVIVAPGTVRAIMPAVIVHGLEDARLALSENLPVTLLSAPGTALYAGCGWWRALVRQVRAAHLAVPVCDILDCGDGAGQALAALRIGQRRLVLSAGASGWIAVAAAVAAAPGGELMRQPPPALDLGEPGAARRLHDWLRG